MKYLNKPFIILIIVSGVLALFNLWVGAALMGGCIVGACIGIQGTWQYIRSRFEMEPRKLTEDKTKEKK